MCLNMIILYLNYNWVNCKCPIFQKLAVSKNSIDMENRDK